MTKTCPIAFYMELEFETLQEQEIEDRVYTFRLSVTQRRAVNLVTHVCVRFTVGWIICA
jgi:hypothetical protein